MGFEQDTDQYADRHANTTLTALAVGGGMFAATGVGFANVIETKMDGMRGGVVNSSSEAFVVASEAATLEFAHNIAVGSVALGGIFMVAAMGGMVARGFRARRAQRQSQQPTDIIDPWVHLK